MSYSFGKNIRVSVFGQSHSEAIGAVIDGLPVGIAIDQTRLAAFMARRRATDALSTPRHEADAVKIVSGLLDGKTCGAPIALIIENTDVRSADYDRIKSMPRPSHADYTAYVKYGGKNDYRGGGAFSGRLTAPLCAAGGIAAQIAEVYGFYAGAQLLSAGKEFGKPFDPVGVTARDFQANGFPCRDEESATRMREQILKAKASGDSVGGVVECAVLGLPVGVGEPNFGGVENVISSYVFGIPAVKGIEFGNGFAAAEMYGSQNNDSMYFDGDKLATKTNNAGGINGGITNGMPVIFRVAFKPTPSIARVQDTVDLSRGVDAQLMTGGRHDPCVAHRAVPVVESMALLACLDLYMDYKKTI